ncbi:MAG: AAA family ATPase [Burkholderiales bacterium]|nr:AAA family ATPase [Burkholderiales bacterium]
MMTPLFAGRDAELKKLLDAYEKAEQGQFSMVMLTGESGSGKTALSHALTEHLASLDKHFIHATGFSNPHSGQGEPYLPFRHALIDLFASLESRAVASVEDKDDSAQEEQIGTRIAKGVLNTLVACAPDLIENFVPGGKIITKIGKHAANEFGLNKKEEAVPVTAREELQADKILEQYTQILKSMSATQTVVLILDDMQWCDTASANLLFHLARSLASERVMLIAIYRNASIALGRNGAKHPLEPVLGEIKRLFGNIWIDLDQVSMEERLALINALVDAEPNNLGTGFRQALLKHTDGHALFASELLQCLKENHELCLDMQGRWIESETLDWNKNPGKMEGVIESRLATLEEDLKTILSIASVQGTQFILQVITRLQQTNERESLQGWGKDLSKKHLLIAEGKTVRVGASILSHFRFSSSIFQQYLYKQMGDSERILLHGDVAAILEELYRGKEHEILYELARHYDLALMPEQAIDYLFRAWKEALFLGAYTEARMQLQRAAELLAELSDQDDIKKLEVDVWFYLSHAVRAIEGWNAPAVKELYEKIQACCCSTQEKDKVLDVAFGLWAIELVSAHLQHAHAIAGKMQEPAQSMQDPITEIRALIALGNTLFWMGELTQVREISEKISALRPQIDSKEYLRRTGLDASTIANQFGSWSLFLQGDQEQAKALCLEAIHIADYLKHSFSQAIAHTTAVFLFQFAQQAEQVLSYADKLIAVSEKNGFEAYRGLGILSRQWALVQLEQSDSVTEIEQGFQLWRQYNGELTASFKSLLLAESLIKLGQLDAAENELKRGLEHVDQSGEIVLREMLLRRLEVCRV